MRRTAFRTASTLILLGGLAAASGAAAEVVVRRYPGPLDLRPRPALPAPEPKLDRPAAFLVLPSFEVDKADPGGVTTLYALRNTAEFAVDVEVGYLDVLGGLQQSSTVTLGPKQTSTVNLFDVPGLAVDGGGIARGAVTFVVLEEAAAAAEVGGQGGGEILRILTGDFFQVDQEENFATGDRMANLDGSDPLFDFCGAAEARFLNGGAFDGGTELTFLISSPQGGDPETDPATLVIPIYDDDGNLLETAEVFTDLSVLKLPISALTAAFSGTAEFFFNATTGTTLVSYRALGRFSVGFKAACQTPVF